VAAAEREGTSLAHYARERGLSANNLYAARYNERRLVGARARRSAFVPIKLTEAGHASSSARVRASLPNGVVLELFVGEQDTRLLGALLTSLSSLPCSD